MKTVVLIIVLILLALTAHADEDWRDWVKNRKLVLMHEKAEARKKECKVAEESVEWSMSLLKHGWELYGPDKTTRLEAISAKKAVAHYTSVCNDKYVGLYMDLADLISLLPEN
jgi:hypothetical protein